MTGIGVIAGLTCKEASRRRILAIAFLLGLAFLTLYGVALHLILQHQPPNMVLRQIMQKFLLTMGLYAVNFLTVMMAVFVSVDTLAGEMASGTMQTLVSKPIARWKVLIGKWLGFVGMITLYVALMAGGVAGLMYLERGFVPRYLWLGLSLMLLEGLLLLSVTFLAGTSLSTLAAGVVGIGLHGLAFLGGWIEEFGVTTGSPTAAHIGVLASLIMPSEALWRRAAYEIQSPMVGALGRGPFSTGSVPSWAMVAYAGLYLLTALALAIYRFSKKDL